MASFFGTGNDAQINPEFISDGVIADPAGSLPSNAADQILGFGGNDRLDGGGGNDRIK